MNMRDDFPILARTQNGRPLVYLDNAATTQKPRQVLQAITEYYEQHNANVHRAAHLLAEEATELLERARKTTQKFVSAERHEEILFTRGTTEGINLIANIIGDEIQAGDVILLTELEHHSNIVPWQMLAARRNARIEVVRVTDDGDLDLDDCYRKLQKRPRLFAVNHVSNALGTVNPIKELVAAAGDAGAITVIDGAQATVHMSIDVVDLNCDFYAISGHKMYGPTGIGALYGRYELLDRLPPWQGGGEMIERVSFDGSTYQRPPYKFEAGTPNIAGAIGLGAAIDYLTALPRTTLIDAEEKLIAHGIRRLKQIPGVRLVGEPKQRSAVISFMIDGAHPNDIGTLLDQQSVAVRTGHHCAMPLMTRLGIPGTVRASFSLYNNDADLEQFIQAVEKATTFI